MRWFPALILALLFPSTGLAASLVLTANMERASLEGSLEHFADATRKLTFEDVQEQRFTLLPEFRSQGYDTSNHWYRAELRRAADAPTRWILAIGIPELEEVDVWVEQADGDFAQFALGYHRPYTTRPLQTRLFSVPINVADGTSVYLRVQTNNAINVSAELWQPKAFFAHETRSNFFRGAYFGVLLIAVVLYATLGLWSRDMVLAAYAGYVASQVLFYMGTNGYLPIVFASDAPWLTDILPRLGWVGGAVSILLMWDRLLELRQDYPRIHLLFLSTVYLFIAMLPFATMPFLVTAPVLVAVKLANALYGLAFIISIILLMLVWRRARRPELMLYFVAFVIPAVGTLVNNGMNLGVLPQNALTLNLYQVSTLVHVLVMSLGLALRQRQILHDKAAAEQDAVAAAQRAEEQRRFVAMLSHEFHNPLASIDRSAQMVQIKTPELSTEETERLDHIRGSAATLSGLVDNFLLTEALDHGALALARESCAIQPLLDDVVQTLGGNSAERIQLSVAPTDANYYLDPAMIGMAISNLVDNALKYSPMDTPVEISVMADDAEVRIRVADRGPGLSTEELENMGTPYYRADSSLGKKGTGLGYYFTQRIVEAHEGQVEAHPRDGGGLVVEIHLPKAPPGFVDTPLSHA